jgi:hypothetical protein
MIDQLSRSEWSWGNVKRPFVQGTRLKMTSDGRPAYVHAASGHGSEDPPFIVYIGQEECGRYAGQVKTFLLHEDQPFFAFVSGMKYWEGAEEETIQRLSSPAKKRQTIRNLGEVKRYEHFVFGPSFITHQEWTDISGELPRSMPRGHLCGVDFSLEVRVPNRPPGTPARLIHETLVLHAMDQDKTLEYEGEFEHIVIPRAQKSGCIRFFFLRGHQLFEQVILPKRDQFRDSALPPAPSPT